MDSFNAKYCQASKSQQLTSNRVYYISVTQRFGHISHVMQRFFIGFSEQDFLDSL